MLNASLLAAMEARKDLIFCGEVGFLQTTAWIAIEDFGLSYEEWAACIRQVLAGHGAEATLRKQYRLAETDRNACLVGDGFPAEQTSWGMKKVVTTDVASN